MTHSPEELTQIHEKLIGFEPPRVGFPWQLSDEDMAFWNDDPAEEIIVATGSIRKAFMVSRSLTPELFESFMEQFKNPLDLQEYFDKEVPNGDGKLQGKVYLGLYHGVPVYAENSFGETEGNNPQEQSQNKVNGLAEKYKNSKVAIIAGDTVDSPNTIDEVNGKKEPLGKVENLDIFRLFPSQKVLSDWYLQAYYKPGTEITHTNGISIKRAADSEPNYLEVILTSVVTPELFAKLKVYVDCGGGGILQQLIDWEEEQNIRDLLDELGSQELANENKDVLKWKVYFQIIGMPWWAFEHALKESLIKENEEELVAA